MSDIKSDRETGLGKTGSDGAAPGLDDIRDWWDGFNASHPDFLL